eukprot:CAMPEP_0174384124 /NCGR_PEP_ID=MMETSP0811_2-20130205/125707_1 /TAXON_ID=73025 ORGANISM="Eutreptiella gymnastica-like, Strain CCMP1594" /NCGR_SAMPLE_ID=MMETSP0811_2 /ASSEMBLY_ACC=CAM_ASM_000667 /LENGTH=139 /DNA_ID=CAMNT_0015537971 /DNA_START=398 /DNA_END=817 /DNA_ORIENTATION=+
MPLPQHAPSFKRTGQERNNSKLDVRTLNHIGTVAGGGSTMAAIGGEPRAVGGEPTAAGRLFSAAWQKTSSKDGLTKGYPALPQDGASLFCCHRLKGCASPCCVAMGVSAALPEPTDGHCFALLTKTVHQILNTSHPRGL